MQQPCLQPRSQISLSCLFRDRTLAEFHNVTFAILIILGPSPFCPSRSRPIGREHVRTANIPSRVASGRSALSLTQLFRVRPQTTDILPSCLDSFEIYDRQIGMSCSSSPRLHLAPAKWTHLCSPPGPRGEERIYCGYVSCHVNCLELHPTRS